jgi:biopolymer transport protein ExbB/TolQ
MPETSEGSIMLQSIVEFFFEDWFASIPITICAFALLAVVLERSIYYARNQRNFPSFIRRLQKELEQDDLQGAMSLSREVGGLIGQMSEEGLRLIAYHARSFSNAYDISSSLYVRDLEQRLPVLATIGTTAPFLGLFGTVVGVIVTLRLLGEQGTQSEVVIGVSKALIATAYGLLVAILAVIFNNWFSNKVQSFENDFQGIKLTLMEYLNSLELENGTSQQEGASKDNRQQQQPFSVSYEPYPRS